MKRRNIPEPDTVFYHAECNDGFCAAWLFHRVFPNADYIPLKYGIENQIKTDMVANKNVIMVDFSCDLDTICEINDISKHFIALDHHKTAEKKLQGLDFCVFSMNKSGARLAYEYLYGDAARPNWITLYVEDRDLWRFELDKSKEVNMWLFSFEHSFEVWDDISKSSNLTVAMRQGERLIAYRDLIVNNSTKNAVPIEIFGTNIYASNVSRDFVSEVGEKLAELAPFGLVWYVDNCGSAVCSLRSIGENADVSIIAEKFGGGGHKNASGFTIKLEDLNKIIKNGHKPKESVNES